MTDGNVFAEEKENLKRTAQISLFGKKIIVKNYLCAKNGCPYKQKPEPLELQLSIVPTFYCGARCSFCSAAASAGNRSFLDIKKLEKVLRELDSKKVIRGISITGGEPFTDINLLNEIIEMNKKNQLPETMEEFAIVNQKKVDEVKYSLDELKNIEDK